MIKLKNILWYFFFSAYWTVHELGEKSKPESNASYLLGINIGWLMLGLCEISFYLGFSFSNLILVFLCVGPAVYIPYRFTNNKRKFAERMMQFSYLRESKYKTKRIKILICVSLGSIIFVTLMALLRNMSKA